MSNFYESSTTDIKKFGWELFKAPKCTKLLLLAAQNLSDDDFVIHPHTCQQDTKSLKSGSSPYFPSPLPYRCYKPTALPTAKNYITPKQLIDEN